MVVSFSQDLTPWCKERCKKSDAAIIRGFRCSKVSRKSSTWSTSSEALDVLIAGHSGFVKVLHGTESDSDSIGCPETGPDTTLLGPSFFRVQVVLLQDLGGAQLDNTAWHDGWRLHQIVAAKILWDTPIKSHLQEHQEIKIDPCCHANSVILPEDMWCSLLDPLVFVAHVGSGANVAQ